MNKSKVIVYGLGGAYQKTKYFLDYTFDILAYADKNWEKFSRQEVIPPANINEYPYEYIYITSLKYSKEIQEELSENYGIDKEKMLTRHNMWWTVHNASTRDEWIIQKIKEIPDGLTLLDAGAGNMPYKQYCNHLNYISQDFGEYDDSACTTGLQIEEWHSRKVDIISDIVNIPLDDKSIDVVLCSEVFEHIKNPVKAVKEFGRIIKKDGILLLTAPFCSLTHMAPYYYANGFSKYWYEENLREAGFEILEVMPYGNWFTYMAQEIERLPYVAERYGKEVDDSCLKLIVEMVHVLMKENEEDKGSNEFLCFGHMVMARKK